MPGVLHQRCLVHMVRNVHKDVGISPKAPLARQLQSCVYRLVKVRSEADRQVWMVQWTAYLEVFSRAMMAGTPCTKAFLGLHTVVQNAYDRNELFTFLAHPGIPYSTNGIEAQNRVLREMLRRHRGGDLSHRKAVVAWTLLYKQTDDMAVIRRHYLRQRHPRADDGGDALFDA